MKPACRNTLSFAEQYCSAAKISRIKTTASFKLVRLMSNTSSAVRKRPHDRCRCKVEKCQSTVTLRWRSQFAPEPTSGFFGHRITSATTR